MLHTQLFALSVDEPATLIILLSERIVAGWGNVFHLSEDTQVKNQTVINKDVGILSMSGVKPGMPMSEEDIIQGINDINDLIEEHKPKRIKLQDPRLQELYKSLLLYHQGILPGQY